MLLKVESYPFTGEAFVSSPDQREPEETVHVCLATAAAASSNDDPGRLLTVGRKTGDIMLPKDKSVSREHAIVRMVTTNKSLPTSAQHKPMAARTAAEQEACQESSFYQCSVVLESVGKLGTFIVEEAAPANTTKSAAKSDGGNDSDTTDDEGDAMISQPGMTSSQAASQLPLSSWARTLVLGQEDASDHSKMITTRLVNKTEILTQLDSDQGRVVVLCGKQESMLVLTRIPLFVQCTKSAFDNKSAVPSWWSELYAAGVVDVSDQVPPGSLLTPQTTHVISAKRSSTHRLLCAWLKGIPIVKADYFHALLQRKSPQDPLPAIEDYATPYPAKSSFWTTSPIPKVWHGLTYVSMKKGDEWPDVVEAMGGTAYRLYQEMGSQAPPAAGGDSSDDEQDEEEQSQQRLSQFDPTCTWSVDLKVRRYTKPLKDAGIKLYSVKEVAKAVASSQILPGLTPAAVSTTPKTPARFETQASKTRQAAANDTNSIASSCIKNSPGVAAKPPPAKQEAAAVKEEPKEDTPAAPSEEPPPSEAEPAKTRSGSARSKAHEHESSDDEPQPKRRRTRTSVAKKQDTVAEDVEDVKDDREKVSKSSRQKTGTKPTEKGEEDAPIANDSPVKEDPETSETPDDKVADEKPASNSNKRGAAADGDEEERPAKRVKLGTSINAGDWLQAAPSDPKKRRAHARTKEEIMQMCGGDNDEIYTEAAATEYVAKSQYRNKTNTTTQSSSRRRGTTTGPNFKAFRKNRVPKLRIVDYQFKPHRSGTAVQQAQLEEEQREADEQYRRANELFKDAPNSVPSTRRRKRQ